MAVLAAALERQQHLHILRELLVQAILLQQLHLKETMAALPFLRAVLAVVAVVALALLGEMVLQAQVEMAALELRQVLLARL
jgi:hypothetical protein